MRPLITALTAAVLGASAGALQAQEMEIGAKLGVSIANVSESVSVDFDGFRIKSSSRRGLMAGGFLALPVAPRIAVQPELLWVSKGVAMEGAFSDEDFGNATFDGELIADYVQIPVLARFDVLPAEGSTRLHLLAGPYIAFESGCKVEFTATSSFGSFSDSEDCGDDGRKKVDFGLDLGAGVGFRTGFGTLFLEARYGLGLRDLSDESSNDFDDFDDFDFGPSSMKHRVFGIMVGVSVPLGGAR
jgi:hypothetical protein